MSPQTEANADRPSKYSQTLSSSLSTLLHGSVAPVWNLKLTELQSQYVEIEVDYLAMIFGFLEHHFMTVSRPTTVYYIQIFVIWNS